MASDMTVYTGPAVLPLSYDAADLILVRMSAILTVAASALGVITVASTNDPSSKQDWSAYASQYQNYRVLSTKTTWIPKEIGFSSNVVAPPIQNPLVLWRSRVIPIPVPGNLSAAWDNSGAVVRNIGQRFVETIRMDGIPDAEWKPTSAPVGTNGLAFYGDGFTSTAVYGTLATELLVQFRDRL
jgi:hypothetical protein